MYTSYIMEGTIITWVIMVRDTSNVGFEDAASAILYYTRKTLKFEFIPFVVIVDQISQTKKNEEWT